MKAAAERKDESDGGGEEGEEIETVSSRIFLYITYTFIHIILFLALCLYNYRSPP